MVFFYFFYIFFIFAWWLFSKVSKQHLLQISSCVLNLSIHALRDECCLEDGSPGTKLMLLMFQATNGKVKENKKYIFIKSSYAVSVCLKNFRLCKFVFLWLIHPCDKWFFWFFIKTPSLDRLPTKASICLLSEDLWHNHSQLPNNFISTRLGLTYGIGHFPMVQYTGIVITG